GNRLVLERLEPPPGAAGCLAGLVVVVGLAPVGIASVMALDLGGLVGHLVLLLGGVVTLGLALYLPYRARRSRVLWRISVDRSSQRLDLVEGPLFEGAWSLGVTVATQSVDLADVATLRFQGTKNLGPSHEALRLRLTFGFREETGLPARAFDLRVKALDRPEEAVDLAQRLAVVAGLAEQRMVRNDPREVVVEFSAPAVPGAEARAEVGATPAAPRAKADYAAGQVSPAAKALAEQEPDEPFDPGAFPSDHRVDRWSPGQEVRLKRPFRFAALGCAPGLLGVLAGPLLFIQMLRFPENREQGTGPLVLVAAFVEVFGVVCTLIAAAVVLQSLSRSVTFDWSDRLLRVRGPLRSRSFDFSEIVSLELRCMSIRSRNSTSFRCDVVAHLGRVTGEPQELLLVSTRSPSDPTLPYRPARSLVVELARALGRPHRVTPYA
ncbi:MAG TPA: hypothetical protein VI669_18560, partial [Vicinamibacteria bacterium]